MSTVLIAATLLTNASYGRAVRSRRKVGTKEADREAEDAAAEAIIQLFDMGARLGYNLPAALSRALKRNFKEDPDVPSS